MIYSREILKRRLGRQNSITAFVNQTNKSNETKPLFSAKSSSKVERKETTVNVVK